MENKREYKFHLHEEVEIIFRGKHKGSLYVFRILRDLMKNL